jgi:hypothetical protein
MIGYHCVYKNKIWQKHETHKSSILLHSISLRYILILPYSPRLVFQVICFSGSFLNIFIMMIFFGEWCFSPRPMWMQLCIKHRTRSCHTQWVLIFLWTWPLIFLPLGATAQGELWPPQQSASILQCDGWRLPR